MRPSWRSSLDQQSSNSRIKTSNMWHLKRKQTWQHSGSSGITGYQFNWRVETFIIAHSNSSGHKSQGPAPCILCTTSPCMSKSIVSWCPLINKAKKSKTCICFFLPPKGFSQNLKQHSWVVINQPTHKGTVQRMTIKLVPPGIISARKEVVGLINHVTIR